ncbi:MAG: hypothetical protein EA353_10225 [Puniceicoccaceae bacterium]|nr:MAG: hypothetical protein EA353_10225 [Puniceicoccaceae bacterium]
MSSYAETTIIISLAISLIGLFLIVDSVIERKIFNFFGGLFLSLACPIFIYFLYSVGYHEYSFILKWFFN